MREKIYHVLNGFSDVEALVLAVLQSDILDRKSVKSYHRGDLLNLLREAGCQRDAKS
jgi:hypothetical protein